MTTEQDIVAMYCRKCGYTLVGLSEARCPECGTGFDPADQRSFLSHPRTWHRRRWWRRLRWTLGIVLAGFVLYASTLWAYLRVYYYNGALAEQPHIAALQRAGCAVTIGATGTWARDLAKPFGWYYMTQRADSLVQGWQQPLTATDLRHAAALGHLRVLRLGTGRFDPAGLACLDNMPELDSLEIYPTPNSRTAINAQMPHFKGLTQLRALYLPYTDLTDDGLRHLQGLSQIFMLSLEHTDITDDGLAHLAGMKQMQWLYLEGTAIRGPGLVHLARMPLLGRLDLADTQVGDADLKHLAALPWLGELNLANTRVSDAGLANLQGFGRLFILNVRGTAVTPQGIQQLQQQRPQLTIHGP